mmetsp:Transcript_2177/g.7136  ORF Transcript_2177/g.7136 Transcript_2177/m.7136 type:complete len:345 (+) Transcript_2177:343-1377(+)
MVSGPRPRCRSKFVHAFVHSWTSTSTPSQCAAAREQSRVSLSRPIRREVGGSMKSDGCSSSPVGSSIGVPSLNLPSSRFSTPCASRSGSSLSACSEPGRGYSSSSQPTVGTVWSISTARMRIFGARGAARPPCAVGWGTDHAPSSSGQSGGASTSPWSGGTPDRTAGTCFGCCSASSPWSSCTCSRSRPSPTYEFASTVRSQARRPTGPTSCSGTFSHRRTSADADTCCIDEFAHMAITAGSPKTWSPCMCEMKMRVTDSGAMPARSICICVCPPQSKSHVSFCTRSATDCCAREVVACALAVPRNTRLSSPMSWLLIGLSRCGSFCEARSLSAVRRSPPRRNG